MVLECELMYTEEERAERARAASAKYRATHAEQIRKRQRVYCENNLDKINQSQYAWQAANPDKVRAAARRWYAKNAERLREKRRKRYAKNPELEKEKRRQWFKDNPDKSRIYVNNRRARKRGNGGSYSAKEWRDLCDRYGNFCIGPGPHGGELEPDHVIPLVKNGPNDIGNIQPLCRRCNASKGTKTVDYRQQSGYFHA
jgi:5-methylcytosine-specific restriction endonuclease McrA